MITERLTEPGRFEVQLEGMPKPLWDLIRPGTAATWGTVLVTPTHLDPAEVGIPALQAKSLFGGVLHNVDQTGGQISGPGLLWHLGGSNIGQVVRMDSIAGEAAPANMWIARAIQGHAPWYWAKSGLLQGTNTAFATSLTWPTSTGAATWYSRIEILEWIRDSLAVPLEWRVTPAGLINVGFPWEVFPSTSQVVITRKESSGWSAIETPSFGAREFGVERSSQDLANIAIALGKDDSEGYGLSPVTYAWLNSVTHDLFHRAVTVSRDDASISWIAAAAAAEVNKIDDIATTITVSGDAYETSAVSVPAAGQWAAVYDPENGIVDTSAAAVLLRGVEIWPQSVRIHSSTWPVRRGMGVYITWWTSVLGWQWLDVSDYVVPDSSPWSLEIARARRGLAVA